VSDWLEWRRGGIGSSDVPAIILGAVPGPWRVWLSKLEPPIDQDNNSMRRGRYLERGVGQWAADELGVELVDTDMVTHPKNKWMRCTPDFALRTESGRQVGLEVKTYRSSDGWGTEGTDQVVEKVKLQVEWQMACTGSSGWVVAVLFTLSDDFRIYIIRRDLERERRMIEACYHWWKAHVIERNPPTLDGSDDCRGWLNEIKPSTRKEIRPATEEEAQMVAVYTQSKEQLGLHKTLSSNYANGLRALIGACRGIKGKDWTLTKSPKGRLNFRRKE